MNKTETIVEQASTVEPPNVEPITSVLHKLFVMNYVPGHKPKSDIFIAENLDEAKKLAFEYCKRFKVRYISVQPFCIDIHKSAEGYDRYNSPKDGRAQND